MVKPEKCRCGADARIRTKEPYVWVECKRKCGLKTGFHRCIVWDQMVIDPHIESAIYDWNRLVKKDG